MTRRPEYIEIIHDLQLTVFSYLVAIDSMFGSSLLRDYLELFDENGDGIISPPPPKRVQIERVDLKK
jgi:hypothetical protein